MNNPLKTLGASRTRGLLVGLILAVVLSLSVFLPRAPEKPVICTFRRITGLPCPSCGMTRAFICLGHGDIRGALKNNLSSPVIYAAFCITLLISVVQIVTGREILKKVWFKIRYPILPIILLLMLVSWIFNLVQHFSS